MAPRCGRCAERMFHSSAPELGDQLPALRGVDRHQADMPTGRAMIAHLTVAAGQAIQQADERPQPEVRLLAELGSPRLLYVVKSAAALANVKVVVHKRRIFANDLWRSPHAIPAVRTGIRQQTAELEKLEERERQKQ